MAHETSAALGDSAGASAVSMPDDQHPAAMAQRNSVEQALWELQCDGAARALVVASVGVDSFVDLLFVVGCHCCWLLLIIVELLLDGSCFFLMVIVGRCWLFSSSMLFLMLF